jgi:hypothetical protein
MSACNPSHPNCLKQNFSADIRFCAGCGRASSEVEAERAADVQLVRTTDDVQEPVLVQLLDVISDDEVDEDVNSIRLADSNESGDELDDAVFADADSEAVDSDLAASDEGVVEQLPQDAQDKADDPQGNYSATVSLINASASHMGVTTPSVSLQGALSDLESWANKWDCKADPYVVGLTRAISQRDDLTMWASLSPREHLPHPRPAGNSGVLDLIVRILTLVRNVLVFVPVAITWYAIGKATEAYGLFTDENPGVGLNFLQFWQKGGFEGREYLSKFWHIGDVARFDALLIALIVLLTLLVGGMTAQRERSNSKFEDSVDAERARLGFVLANALHGRRSASPESIGESLAEALNDLTQAARDVNDVAARLERATVGVDTLGPKLDVLNQHTDRLVGQSVQSITTSMSALVASVGQLNSSVSGNVTQVFADATANLEEVSAQFSRIAASMEIGAAQLREDLDQINKHFGTGSRSNRS